MPEKEEAMGELGGEMVGMGNMPVMGVDLGGSHTWKLEEHRYDRTSIIRTAPGSDEHRQNGTRVTGASLKSHQGPLKSQQYP